LLYSDVKIEGKNLHKLLAETSTKVAGGYFFIFPLYTSVTLYMYSLRVSII